MSKEWSESWWQSSQWHALDLKQRLRALSHDMYNNSSLQFQDLSVLKSIIVETSTWHLKTLPVPPSSPSFVAWCVVRKQTTLMVAARQLFSLLQKLYVKAMAMASVSASASASSSLQAVLCLGCHCPLLLPPASSPTEGSQAPWKLFMISPSFSYVHFKRSWP